MRCAEEQNGKLTGANFSERQLLEREKEMMMKLIRVLFTVMLFLAGVLLLIHPLRAQTPPKPGNPAQTSTRITVVDAGTAGKPDVVLIPGMASSRAVWDAEAKLLAPNYRLHLVQVNGFAGAPAGGNATGAILPGVVDELHAYISANTMHPAMIGHSMGGLLALMLADKYPADVRKMIIVDSLPFYGLVFDPNATVESVASQGKAVRDQMLAMPDDQFAAMQPMLVTSMVKNAEGQKLVAAGSIASDRAVFANSMLEDLETDLRPEMAKIKTPVLLLYPYDDTLQHDPAKVEALYKSAYAGMPNVTMERIDGSRHFIMYDQPVKMDAAIEEFLK
jgi:pimeloyl-ACP methyl ester carboxylesterase